MLKYIDKFITLEFNKEKCINCKMCFTVCPHRVFSSDVEGIALSHPEKCIECGACMSNCPTEAINVEAGVGCAIAVLGTGGGCC